MQIGRHRGVIAFTDSRQRVRLSLWWWHLVSFFPVREIAGGATETSSGLRDRDGVARALSGDWRGPGFSLAVWPGPHAGVPCFLEMHRTSESLLIAPIEPCRGDFSSLIGPLEPSTLVFDQDVSDLTSGVRLVRERGMWFLHPASEAERLHGQNVTLISTAPGSEPVIAAGSIFIATDPNPVAAIEPVTTAPFALSDPIPDAGTRGAFLPYDLEDRSEAAVQCRTLLDPCGPAALEGLKLQAVLDDPTSLLRAVVERQVVERLKTIHVANNAALELFVTPERRTGALGEPAYQSTFWIESIREGAHAIDQLQYVQTTTAQFAPSAEGPPFIWPQVRVATLRRAGASEDPIVDES